MTLMFLCVRTRRPLRQRGREAEGVRVCAQGRPSTARVGGTASPQGGPSLLQSTLHFLVSPPLADPSSRRAGSVGPRVGRKRKFQVITSPLESQSQGLFPSASCSCLVGGLYRVLFAPQTPFPPSYPALCPGGQPLTNRTPQGPAPSAWP